MADEILQSTISCAKCGFLYALKNSGGQIFDPDLLRSPQFFTENATIDNPDISTQFVGVERPGTLQDGFKLICYQGVIQPFRKVTNRGQLFPLLQGFLEKHRSSGEFMCNEFINYRPGFSAKEHAEIRLQEERDKQQQEFQKRQNALFLEWEEIAAKRDVFWKQQLEKAESEAKKYKVRIDLITIAIAFLALIVSGVAVYFAYLEYLKT